MPTVMTVNIDDIDSAFVENLKKDFAHAAVEIRLQEQPGTASSFSESDFWNIIKMLDWTQEENDDKVIAPAVDFLATQPLSHIYRFFDILSENIIFKYYHINRNNG